MHARELRELDSIDVDNEVVSLYAILLCKLRVRSDNRRDNDAPRFEQCKQLLLAFATDRIDDDIGARPYFLQILIFGVDYLMRAQCTHVAWVAAEDCPDHMQIA